MDKVRIIAATSTAISGAAVDGLVVVSVDSLTLEYQSHEFFHHSYVILRLDWDSATDRLLTLDRLGFGQIRVALNHLSQDQVVIEQEVVGAEWNPFSVSFPAEGAGVIVAATDPISGVTGIYRFYPDSGGYSDSLMFTSTRFIPAPSGVAVDGMGSLFLEEREIDGTSSITRVDPESDPGNNSTVLFRRDSPIISIDAHPTELGTLVISYRFEGGPYERPEDVIEILRPPYTTPIRVDSRTHVQLCRFPTNERVSWDPTGNHVAFPSGARTGEGDWFIQKLWIAKNVLR
jgi:hypothetical protein